MRIFHIVVVSIFTLMAIPFFPLLPIAYILWRDIFDTNDLDYCDKKMSAGKFLKTKKGRKILEKEAQENLFELKRSR